MFIYKGNLVRMYSPALKIWLLFITDAVLGGSVLKQFVLIKSPLPALSHHEAWKPLRPAFITQCAHFTQVEHFYNHPNPIYIFIILLSIWVVFPPSAFYPNRNPDSLSCSPLRVDWHAHSSSTPARNWKPWRPALEEGITVSGFKVRKLNGA